MSNPTPSHKTLRFNVGFILKEGAGYSRTISFDEPGSILAEDTLLNHLKGVVRLTRTPQGILAQGEMTAEVSAECVRCLKPFDLPFTFEISELFVPVDLMDRVADPSAEEPYIIDEAAFIDLTPLIREEGILAVPIQALCTSDCKGLCPQCGQNLNEGACDCQHDSVDPRLAPLRVWLDKEKRNSP